jgi:hypothetical protein
MLNKISDRQLVDEVIIKVKAEKKLVAEVISYLGEIDRRKVFADYGVSSLFKFCTRILKYSDAEAGIRVKAVRAVKRIPEIMPKMKAGTLGLTAVAQVETFLQNNPGENKTDVVRAVEGKSANEVKKILAERDRSTPSPQVKLVLPERVAKKLLKIQEEFDDCSELEAIEALIDQHQNAKFHGREKRKSHRQSKNQRYIPREVKEVVDKRAAGRCEAVSPLTGKRCECRTNLQYDHVRPISSGGESTSDNLRKYCPAHNLRAGVKQLGVDMMTQYGVIAEKECVTGQRGIEPGQLPIPYR